VQAVLEVCVDNIRSATAAKQGGANRLEVCGPLAVGGTTPSAALVEQCVDLGDIDVMVMIRPHCGDFVYDQADVRTMLRDIEIAKSAGANGVVFGALTDDRKIDLDVCRQLTEAAESMQVTFHRAFDVVDDPVKALEQLAELKVDRILTSGQSAKAIDGLPLIKSLIAAAAGRVTILPGSGINSKNVSSIILETGGCEIHASCSVVSKTQGYSIDFGGAHFTTDHRKVSELRAALNAAIADR